MKGWIWRFLELGILLLGAGLVSYPWVSNRLYEEAVDSRVDTWRQEMESLSREGELERMRQEAETYNRWLASSKIRLTDPFLAEGEAWDDGGYEACLSSDPSGIMGFVRIPGIDVDLPIYHGTDPSVLEMGIGHLEGSSLPVGGPGTHAVLSGHTGLNSARLFTDLILLEEGDLFEIRVLGESLQYRVKEIQVIEPWETECLAVRQEEDLVSLLTCTPYGVNTHRLVVTGERWEGKDTEEEPVQETEMPESVWLASYRKALAMGICAVLLLMVGGNIWERLRRRFRRRRHRRKRK